MPSKTSLGIEYSQFENYNDGCPNTPDGKHVYADSPPLTPDNHYYRYGEPRPWWRKCKHCEAYMIIDSSD